jgi:cytochrome c biogenesis protein CcdA
MSLTLGLVSVTALLDSINPCAISVLLLTIGFLVSLGHLRSYILKIGSAYIIAIYITYLCIGLGVLRAMSIFGFPHIFAKVGALILGLTAVLNLTGWVKLKMPDSSHPILAKYIGKATFPSALVLGVLVGLFEFPCTGGPYLSILGLLHDRATFLSGFAYLAYYNFIFVLPLVIILFLASRPGLLDKVNAFKKDHSKLADTVANVLMLLLSAVIWMTS